MKFSGIVGFEIYSETSPGIYTATIIPHRMRGDIIRLLNRNEKGEKINDDFTLSNQISFVADKYTYENFQHIVYVEVMGARYRVTSANILRPRLILEMGGLYNSGDNTTKSTDK